MKSPIIPLLYFSYLDSRNKAYTVSGDYLSTDDIIKLANLYSIPVDGELRTYIELKEILVNEGIMKLINEVYNNIQRYVELESRDKYVLNTTFLEILRLKKRIGELFLKQNLIEDSWNIYSDIIELALSSILQRYTSIIDGLRGLAEVMKIKELASIDNDQCLPRRPCNNPELLRNIDIDIISKVVEEILEKQLSLKEREHLERTIARIEKDRIRNIVLSRLNIKDPIVILDISDINNLIENTGNKVVFFNNLNEGIAQVIKDLKILGEPAYHNIIPLYSTFQGEFSLEQIISGENSAMEEIRIIPSNIITILEETIRKLPLKIIRDVHIKIKKNELRITYNGKEVDIFSLVENIRREYGEKISMAKKDGFGLNILSRIMLST